MEELTALQHQLRFAARLICLSLLVEAVCLIWARPLAFIVFVTVSGILAFAGFATYFLSLVRGERSIE
jgi:hypothetical protein